MSILYIDDDKDDREIFVEAIKVISPNITCYTAGDGMEGLQLLYSLVTPPEMIFLDVNMPKMDGKQFLENVSRISAFRLIPIYMYSTSTDCLEHSDYILRGAKDFITKRSSFQQICETIREAIGEFK